MAVANSVGGVGSKAALLRRWPPPLNGDSETKGDVRENGNQSNGELAFVIIRYFQILLDDSQILLDTSR